MKLILFFLSFYLFLLSCSSKNEKTAGSNIETVLPPEINPRNFDEIGFKCYADGGETDLVYKYANLIKDKNYKKIRSDLYSSKPGEVYLATMSSEKLALEGIIKLNQTEIRQIEKNRNKIDTIYTCSGCTEDGYYTVKQLLSDTTNSLRLQAKWWFDELVGKNIVLE